MNLHGAKFEEIIGIINHAAREAGEWRLSNGQLVTEVLIYGVNLRLRHVYHDKGLTFVSLTGQGWNVSFNVTKQRPRSMADEVRSEMADIMLAPQEAITLLSREYGKLMAHARNRGTFGPPAARLCFHGGGIMSPEEFRKEMSLLRLFSSEWEL